MKSIFPYTSDLFQLKNIPIPHTRECAATVSFFCVLSSSSSFCVFISSSQSERKALRKSLKDLFTFLFGLVVVARVFYPMHTHTSAQATSTAAGYELCACLDEFRIALTSSSKQNMEMRMMKNECEMITNHQHKCRTKNIYFLCFNLLVLIFFCFLRNPSLVSVTLTRWTWSLLAYTAIPHERRVSSHTQWRRNGTKSLGCFGFALMTLHHVDRMGPTTSFEVWHKEESKVISYCFDNEEKTWANTSDGERGGIWQIFYSSSTCFKSHRAPSERCASD